MIRKDYLMRLLKEFLDGLTELLTHAKNENNEQILARTEGFYPTYLNQNRSFFIENSLSEIIPSIITENEEESAIKCEMLAELLFLDANHMQDKDKQEDTYKKILFFFDYAEQHSTTFSENRMSKIATLKGILD
ncbi:MAG TPA: hypothetical protein PLQ09_02290 [Prolixibacteraceae bacterium]|jgi:hypothetical protein|nr:hypothetical protein [Prolixibacteraceae bacterium]